MGEEDLATFRKHTGRTAPREGGYADAVVITGGQSGIAALGGSSKSFIIGDPGGIRTLDLHLERVACWASAPQGRAEAEEV
jgi:hypothetical protein